MKEILYRQRYEGDGDSWTSGSRSQAHYGYKAALKELYIRILKFQAQSICYFSGNQFAGIGRAMFKMDDWQGLLGDIQTQEATCDRYETLFIAIRYEENLVARNEAHMQRTLALLSTLDGFRTNVREIRDEIRERHYTDEESQCFETLRTSDYQGVKDHNPPRLAGTCDWLFNHPKFLEWSSKSPTSKLLWVSADPGCGKSVLVRSLVDEYVGQDVSYFFFKTDSKITRSQCHALCALLH